MSTPVGTHTTVTINGIDYDTVIDKGGVQRFVGNPIVAKFVQESIGTWQKWCDDNPHPNRNWLEAPFSLNDISYVPGDPYTLDELIQFSALHGYSVGGMCDLSFMNGVEVKNPLWD